MKAYARHYTLKRISKDVGWGWVQTNQYGSDGKSHLLQMRREGLVQYKDGTSPRVEKGLGYRPSYADRLANYYTITFKGLVKLLELWPDDYAIYLMKRDLFDGVFQDYSDYWNREIKARQER